MPTPPQATEKLDGVGMTVTGCRLVVLDGPDAGKELDLPDGEAVVGTDAGCDLRLTDRAVSTEHLRVQPAADGVRVADLNSTNGTRYLGTQLHDATVAHGAVLTLGRTRLAISSRHPPPGSDCSDRSSYGEIIGGSVAMRRLYALLEKIEPFNYPVLLQGETGVGKELVAKEIFRNSTRGAESFEVLDCGTLPAQVAESELFGHEKGAFTGAVGKHQGIFSRASGGTVFLDEIGELPLELQSTLLRVLESGELRPVGGSAMQTVDVRIIAATNRALADEVEAGRFRQDLYYRLNVVTITIPPLRRRREDIPDLLQRIIQEHGLSDLELSPDTVEQFTCGYHWPGNVRELKNAIMQVLSLGSSPEQVLAARAGAEPSVVANPDEPFREARKKLLDGFESDYLSFQLARSDNNITRAAEQSGLDRSHFKRLLKRHGLLDSKKK